MKVTKGELYTWESADIPVIVLEKGKAIGMVTVETEDHKIHFIDEGNLINLTSQHQNLNWCRLLSNDE